MVQPEDVLGYWFGPLDSDAVVPADRQPLWWGKDAATDYFIRQAYEPTVTRAAAGELDDWKSDARGSLAWIVTLDQFSRNIYRGFPAAFENDLACQIQTLEGIEAGFDKLLRPIERVFYYLPLEHAEDLEVQERSVGLFEALAADAPAPVKKDFAGFLDYAVKHHDVIARFGRFPHRNEVLGRVSTPEEQAYLDAGGGF